MKSLHVASLIATLGMSMMPMLTTAEDSKIHRRGKERTHRQTVGDKKRARKRCRNDFKKARGR